MKKNIMADILAHEGSPTMKMTIMAVLTLSLPAIIEQIMITMVQYVDTAMVGSLGSTATAAVGVTASTTWLINGIMTAASVGFSVQVAQLVGAKEHKSAKRVVAQSIKFTAIFGCIIGAIAFSISPYLPLWFGAEEELAFLATSYFRIIALSVPFNLCSLMLGGAIRCSGDTKTPMFLNLMINVLNVLFNFLFIYPTRQISLFGLEFTMIGAGMGVAGAALGSTLALVLISISFIIVLFKKESPIKIEKETSFKFSPECLKTALRIGLPVAFERGLLCVAQITITTVITALGTVAIAANYVAVTAESLSYMPAYGIATAGTTMVGQSIGAKRYDLAKRFSRITTYLGIAIMTFGGFLLYVLAPNLIGIFSSEVEVITLGTEIIRIVAFAQPFFAMAIVITGVLRGAGDTKAPFVISLITMWGVRITLAFLLSTTMGLVGVWIAMAVELFVRGILFMFRLYSDKWLTKGVV